MYCLKMNVSIGLRRSLEGILVVVSSIHRLRGKIYDPSQSKLSAWIDEAKYISHVFPMDSFRHWSKIWTVESSFCGYTVEGINVNRVKQVCFDSFFLLLFSAYLPTGVVFNNKEIEGLTAGEIKGAFSPAFIYSPFPRLYPSNSCRTSKALVLLHVTPRCKYLRDRDDPNQLRVAENWNDQTKRTVCFCVSIPNLRLMNTRSKCLYFEVYVRNHHPGHKSYNITNTAHIGLNTHTLLSRVAVNGYL